MPRMGVSMSLVAALLSIADASAVAASKRPVTLDPVVAVGGGRVLLTGRVSTSDTRVVLQRSADGRWVKARILPVHGHSYRTTVPARPRAQRFRVKVGDLTSHVRIVGASRPTPTQDACGKRPRKPGGARWSCTFVDDFDAAKLDRSRWVPHPTFVTGNDSGNYACHRDHPDNVSVAGGTLRLTVLELDQPIACGDPRRRDSAFTSGSVSTYHRFSQRYDRFEARFKVTATAERGLQEAFWMWPDERDAPVKWPTTGEIDVAETYSQHPDLAIPFLHYTTFDNGGPRPGLNTAWDCVAHRGEFNTFTLEWTATRLEILVNGKTCLVNTSGDPAFQKPYIVALTQMLGTDANAYTGQAPLPATMTVDYVRVWK